MNDPDLRASAQAPQLTVPALLTCGNGHDWALVEVEFSVSGSVCRSECRCGAINYHLTT